MEAACLDIETAKRQLGRAMREGTLPILLKLTWLWFSIGLRLWKLSSLLIINDLTIYILIEAT